MSLIIFSIEPVRGSIRALLKKEEIVKSIEYEVYSNENNKIKILLKVTDTENGVSEIKLPDGDKLIANGQNNIGIDYVIEANGEYTFISRSTTGEEMTETINVNEEYRNNLIGIDKIQEISTEQDYSITKKYDGESQYTYYYAIGENNTEWIQIPEYKIVNVDSYKVNELNWKNEDGTVTLKVKKVGTSGNTVEVKKKITDLNVTGIEFNDEERIIEGESIIACVRDNELESGNYRLKVNGEEYPAEVYNYQDENVNYITDKNLGTREADNRMLIMKYNGNLTINEKSLITAETRKKGMFLYVTEELTNNGKISMTEKGANAEGQDVYLLKNPNNSYEYIPAEGAAGASGVYHSVYGPSKESSKNGQDGTNAENRATGGGGSGRVYLVAASNYSFRLSATSGAGTSGTSYSGGKGGGPAYKSGSGNNEYGSNGETGVHEGAGGLLILYINKLNNIGNIESKGKNSTLAGATGGGSINIFYNELINQGTIEATGGIIEASEEGKGIGGKGGNGTVTLNNLNEMIEPIEPPIESYVGYYADIEGDGIIDGVIFADLEKGNTGSGKWNNSFEYTIPTETGLKDYYISKTGHEDKFGIKDVITPVEGSEGKDRFYIMALTDFGLTNTYPWYYAAYTYKMGDYSTATSSNFGTGKSNTTKMVSYWNNKRYGQQNAGTSKDMWGEVQEEVAKGWFVPSKSEWAAFSEELGMTKDNYENYGLNDRYWSSTQNSNQNIWFSWFSGNSLGIDFVKNNNFVRLATTF